MYAIRSYYVAAEHGIDISRITGTGIDGRVTKKDVENYLAGTPPPTAPPAPPPAREKVSTPRNNFV